MERNIFTNLFFALLYSIVFSFIYTLYLYPVHGYAHHDINNHGIIFWILGLFISIFPILFYKGIKNISDYFAIMFYILVYIPTIITFTFALDSNKYNLGFVLIIYMLSMILFFIVNRVKISNNRIAIKQQISIKSLTIITLLAITIIVFAYKDHLRLVSFDEIYDHRAESNNNITSSFIGYLFMIASGSLFPLLISYGLYEKKMKLIIIGFFGCLLGYLALAAKGSLFLPFIIIILYFIINKTNRPFALLSITLSFISALILILAINYPNNILIQWSSSILFQRTLGTPGLLNYLYYIFFSNNTLTYFSHINIINNILGIYPYKDQGLGFVIGNAYYGPEMNANANFWAMDGLASLGLYGVIIISITIFIFLIILNHLMKNTNIKLNMIIFTPFIMNLCNVSFFTSFLSGGGAMTILLILLLNKRITK
jgi:hypothetical protein